MAQNLTGFFLIDKPKAMNSFKIVAFLRKLLSMRRVGYAGTLDPLATGLMLVAVGEATKILSFLEKMDKVYEVEITLGAVSDTYDSEGPVTSTGWQGEISRSLIEDILEKYFSGEVEQMPPQFSAVKVGGKRAYASARKGIHIALKSRKVTFYDIQIRHFSWPKLTVMVHCSSGTYIRSLAHDLGQKLGCGGYVSELRRTKVGRFSIQPAVPLHDLSPQNFSNFLLKPQELLSDWLQFQLNGEQYNILANGGFIENPDQFATDRILAIHDGQCVGLLETVRDGTQLKFLRKFIIV